MKIISVLFCCCATITVHVNAQTKSPADLAQEFQAAKVKAEAGDVDAQYAVGGMYGKGAGVSKDDAEAVKWYRKVAEQNDVRGQSMLGVMYTNARGVTRDYDEAMKWFRRAADFPRPSGPRRKWWR